MFGESARKQCVCCSMCAICITVVKPPGRWESSDLDFIVKNCDILYNSTNTTTLFCIGNLPQIVPRLDSQVITLNFQIKKLDWTVSLSHFLFTIVFVSGVALHFLQFGLFILKLQQYKQDTL